MTIRASHLTPEVMLSAPRRSPGIPNSDGSKVLYSVSQYSFAKHSQNKEIRILDTKTQETSLVTDANVAGIAWLGDDTILLLTSGAKGVTHVKFGNPVAFATK